MITFLAWIKPTLWSIVGLMVVMVAITLWAYRQKKRSVATGSTPPSSSAAPPTTSSPGTSSGNGWHKTGKFLKGLFKILVGLFALVMIASCPMMNAYISWDKYQREINRNGPSSSVEIKKTVTIYKEKWSPSVLLNGAAFDVYVLHDDIKMEIKAIYNDGSEEFMDVNGDDQNKRFRRANDIKAIQFRLKSTSGYNETDVTVVFNRPILEAQSVL